MQKSCIVSISKNKTSMEDPHCNAEGKGTKCTANLPLPPLPIHPNPTPPLPPPSSPLPVSLFHPYPLYPLSPLSLSFPFPPLT